MPVYVRAGDTFFTHSSTLLGRLIRWGEKDKGEDASWANHTGVVVEDGWVGAEGVPPEALPHNVPAVVIEALWHVRKGPLVLNGTEVRFFRPIPAYDAAELGRFVAEAETYVGDKYGWWKLAVLLADRQFFGGEKILSTALYIKDRPICSFLAAFVNQAAQSVGRVTARVKAHLTRGDNGAVYYAFGLAPQSADPDEQMDYCIANPTEWEEVK